MEQQKHDGCQQGLGPALDAKIAISPPLMPPLHCLLNQRKQNQGRREQME